MNPRNRMEIIPNQYHTKEDKAAFLSSMNSYLGIMKHYKSYKLRKRMIFKKLSAYWFNHVYLSGGIAKFVLKVRDRKSTRLNSSHVRISYAVFCLKKKKKIKR